MIEDKDYICEPFIVWCLIYKYGWNNETISGLYRAGYWCLIFKVSTEITQHK